MQHFVNGPHTLDRPYNTCGVNRTLIRYKKEASERLVVDCTFTVQMMLISGTSQISLISWKLVKRLVLFINFLYHSEKPISIIYTRWRADELGSLKVDEYCLSQLICFVPT